MKEEKYKAKCPGYVLIADVAYLEEYQNGKTESEVIDYRPPPEFQMGILLEQFRNPFEGDCIRYAINLYFAPEQDLDKCMNNETVTWQGFTQKWADTKNTCYKVMVDERQENVKTESDGIWSQYQEFYSCDRDVRKTKAVLVTLVVPDDETFEGMKRLVYSLFEGVQPIQSEEKWKQSDKEELSIRGTLMELRNAKSKHRGEKMLPRATAKKQKETCCKHMNPER